MAHHTIDPEKVHHRWDAQLDPSLVISSGDSVAFDLTMSGRGQVEEGGSIDSTKFDFDTIYNLLGPVWVDDAVPGDTLEIEIEKLEIGDWGWSVVLPELGLLAEDFPVPFLRTFDLRDGQNVAVSPTASVPVRPFLGTMGNHPRDLDVASPFPPHDGGGNIDNRHLGEGATVRLPVHRNGALFSCGDPHAVQGDGEVCCTAVECDMRAVLRFTLIKKTIATPEFDVPAGELQYADGAYIGTMGSSPDLVAGAKIAVRAMIDRLGRDFGCSREDAYILASLAGDLRIHQVVNAAVWTVGFTMPRGLFDA